MEITLAPRLSARPSESAITTATRRPVVLPRLSRSARAEASGSAGSSHAPVSPSRSIPAEVSW